MGSIEAAPLVLDVKTLAFIWTVMTIIFSAGAVWATIRFTIKSVAQTAVKLEGRVDALEQHRSSDREEYRAWRDESAAAVRQAIADLDASIGRRIGDQEGFMKQVLFRQDGVTNYLPRNECEQCRLSCQSRLDARLESIQRAIEEADRRREASKDDITKAYERLMESVSRLQGRTNDRRGGSDGHH